MTKSLLSMPVLIDGAATTGGPQFQCVMPGCESTWFTRCYRLQYTKDLSFVQRVKLLFPFSDQIAKSWACVKCGAVIVDGSNYDSGGGLTFEPGRLR